MIGWKYRDMNSKKKFLVRLFLLLFTVSISTSVLPGAMVQARGLFGEVTASAAQEQEQVAEHSYRQQIRPQQSKGCNIYNLWFLLSVGVVWICRRAHLCKLPREDTIIGLKVRMNN